MKSSLLAQLCVALLTNATPTAASPLEDLTRIGPPKCRFASQWSQDDVLKNPSAFEWDLLYWEGRFHQNDVAYNTANGMSYDGTQLNWTTGARTKKHPFSAASKEVRASFILNRYNTSRKEERIGKSKIWEEIWQEANLWM